VSVRRPPLLLRCRSPGFLPARTGEGGGLPYRHIKNQSCLLLGQLGETQSLGSWVAGSGVGSLAQKVDGAVGTRALTSESVTRAHAAC
jgi:hypothetical protein